MLILEALAQTTPEISGVIVLPENFISNALAYIGELFTDLSPIILVVIGLPLAFWTIRKIISLVRAR